MGGIGVDWLKQLSMINFRPQEKIHLILRRHRITLAIQISTLWVLAIMIWVILAFLNNNYPGVTEQYRGFVWFGLSIYYLSLWLKLFIILVEYYLDVSIVTGERLIDVNQVSLFHREVSEFPLRRVQDVSVRVIGPIATLLEFGDVIIRTASEHQMFIFEKIPNPYKVKDLILDLLRQSLPSHPHENSPDNNF